jgi:hypothetical protein
LNRAQRPGRRIAGRPITVVLTALITLGVGACDSFLGPPPSPTPLATTTPSATPSEPPDELPTPRASRAEGAVDIVAATEALVDLRSYRVRISARNLVPSAQPDGAVTMTETVVSASDPSAVAFTITGADLTDGETIDAIVIGEEAWLKNGNGKWAKSPGGAADFDAVFTTLSPDSIVFGFDDIASAMTMVGSETKNGRAADHYRLDAATDAAVASAAGMTAGSADLWLASEGQFLIGMAVDATTNIDGTASHVVLTIDIDRINDPRNVVRAPS